jgi:hypothetical protein
MPSIHQIAYPCRYFDPLDPDPTEELSHFAPSRVTCPSCAKVMRLFAFGARCFNPQCGYSIPPVERLCHGTQSPNGQQTSVRR